MSVTEDRLEMRAPFQTAFRCPSALRCAVLGCALALSSALAAAEDEAITIGDLLKSGWQIAGYTGAFDERSAFILFKHPSESHLVQCRAGYDVTREPREFSNCYKLR
jgi:hypothetical protein